MACPVPVGKVWGIGRAHEARLLTRKIKTALDFALMDPQEVRGSMGIVGARMIHKLRGQSCLSLEEIAPAKKQIVCAKSFGSPLTELPEIEQALASYADRVGEKLRAQGSMCGAMQVFLLTNTHRPDQPQYTPAMTVTIPESTNYSPELIATSLRILRKIWRPGYRFRKVSVVLLDIRESVQLDLFASPGNKAARARLQAAVDGLGGAVRWGSMGFDEDWRLRANHKSNRWTTNVDELPMAKAISD